MKDLGSCEKLRHNLGLHDVKVKNKHLQTNAKQCVTLGDLKVTDPKHCVSSTFLYERNTSEDSQQPEVMEGRGGGEKALAHLGRGSSHEPIELPSQALLGANGVTWSKLPF